MTGKQAEFVRQYLGPCRFNATAAAKASGYRCTSQHSFEEVGLQNLKKPEVRAAIDEHFKYSRMTAQEVLQELTALARGNSKEKLRALALLSSHFGILDGRGSQEQIETQAQQLADRRMEEYAREVEKEVEEYNRKAEANNRDKDKQFHRIVKRYQHNEEAVAALQLMCRVMKDKARVEEEPEPPQPEPEITIIPPQRQLGPSPAERMMQAIEPEVVEPDPEPCGHGYITNDCYICDHIAATQRAWFG